MAALAYSLVIIYASLQPFTGWQYGQTPPGAFLLQPWPRWITLEDVVFNVVAYLPLGFLLALSLCARVRPGSAVLLATLAGTLLSGAMEAAQQHLPARIASVVDLLLNSGGTAAGALIAPLFAPGRRLGEELALLRNSRFIGGARGDAVLVIAGLWLLTQLHAAPISMGNGDLRSLLALRGLFAYTPESYRYAEAGVVMFNVAALGLLLASVARSTGSGFWRTLALLLAGAAALKVLMTLFILRAENPWVWLTPGLAMGMAAAAVLLLLLARLPPRGCAVAALLALLAAVLLVNGTPENPYRNLPPHLVPGRLSHVLSFTSMIRALSDLWPFLTLLYLLFSLPGSPARRR